MSKLLEIPAHRGGKFTVLALAVVFFMALASQGGKLEDAQENDAASFLPGGAESVEALEKVQEFPSGERADAVTVFQREDGLTAADRAYVARTRARLNQDPPPDASETSPPIRSRDGTTALLVTPIAVDPKGQSDALFDATDEIRAQVEDAPAGLEAKVTGAGRLLDRRRRRVRVDRRPRCWP